VDANATVGTEVTLSVDANGTEPLAYQWQKNGVDIGGSTAATLPFTNVQLADGGVYRVKVTNPYGSATSNGATLNVGTIPAIVAHPTDQNASTGSNVTFDVNATGTSLTYQWQKNGVNISGATSSTLTLRPGGASIGGIVELDEEWNGKLDGLRVYNRDLNGTEIGQLAESNSTAPTINFYVSTTGSNSNNGLTAQNPFKTIQHAIDTAANGQVILVQPGTYTENINFNGKNITVGSLYMTTGDKSHISTTIIDGNQNGSVVTFDSGEDSTAVLSGSTITNGRSSYGGGIEVNNSSSPNLNHLIIKNNTATGTHNSLGGGGLYIDGNSDATISNVQIINNNSSSRAGGVWIGYSDPLFTNVLIANNISVGDGGGISTYINTKPTFINTSIINNSSNGNVGGIYIYNTTEIVIMNSIISGNSGKQIKISSQPQIQKLSISYSLVEGGQCD
jgi:hypothetical protein